MKKQFFENEKDGFYGTYYENRKGADCAVIGLFGDDPNDYMAKCGAKWLHRQGVNVCISGQKKLQSCQQSAGKNSDRNKVVTGSWKTEDRYYGNEHGWNGCDRCSILFPGYYDDDRAYGQ